MNDKDKLLGFYNYTVILTYIGMLAGFTGIIYTFEKNIQNAIICLMISGFCDMFDGAIASTNKKRTEKEKCFGIQIDSLSDLICFGVLPALIVYCMNEKNTFVLGISAMYVLCALIRLAYFNVDEQERQRKSASAREIYYGLPVTLSALLLPVFYALNRLLWCKSYITMNLALFIMGVLFLLPFPLKKPKIMGKICVVFCGVMEILLLSFVCLEL